MSDLKTKLLRELKRIPGVKHQPWPERDDGFSTIHFDGREIAHFHNFNEIDLRLGKRLIKQKNLKHPIDSVKHPKRTVNSQFIEIRFTNNQDIRKVVRLIKLAIGVPSD